MAVWAAVGPPGSHRFGGVAWPLPSGLTVFRQRRPNPLLSRFRTAVITWSEDAASRTSRPPVVQFSAGKLGSVRELDAHDIGRRPFTRRDG